MITQLTTEVAKALFKADSDFDYTALHNIPVIARGFLFEQYWKPYLETKGYCVTHYAAGKWHIEKGVMKLSYWPYGHRMLNHYNFFWGDCTLLELINTVHQLSIFQNSRFATHGKRSNSVRGYGERGYRAYRGTKRIA